jgi:hypothetical protein
VAHGTPLFDDEDSTVRCFAEDVITIDRSGRRRSFSPSNQAGGLGLIHEIQSEIMRQTDNVILLLIPVQLFRKQEVR